MLNKLKKLADRHIEISNLLAEGVHDGGSEDYKKLVKELSKLEPCYSIYSALVKLEETISSYKNSLSVEKDSDMTNLIEEEINDLFRTKEEKIKQAQLLLIPKDDNDDSSVIIEIRAGTGGDEAGLFVADLARMYQRYAENLNFKVNNLDSSPTGVGGFKDFIFQVEGKEAYRHFKHEAGTHRVQRVPNTESQGRIHTSTVTVAVLPEAEDIEEIQINTADLKIDTYRSQGAGGQHVNTTDSAVRITHIPTGIVVASQEERSQIKNRAKALSYLKVKIYEQELEKKNREESQMRKNMVGTGDRSERIRTYNYSQGRISDHRIKLSIYNLEEVMQSGNITEIVNGLLLQEQILKLENLRIS